MNGKVHQFADALAQRRIRGQIGHDKARKLGNALGINLSKAAFYRQIITVIKLANTRGIARAADVFQQQCVIQIGKRLHRQTNLRANIHADPADANAMPGG